VTRCSLLPLKDHQSFTVQSIAERLRSRHGVFSVQLESQHSLLVDKSETVVDRNSDILS